MTRYSIEVIGEPWDARDSNIDVIVSFDDGRVYSGTLATLNNIRTIMEENYPSSGELLSGKYFWCVNLVVTRDNSMETIRAVIDDLVVSKGLFTIFMQIE